jgi:UDP-N-acetylmuramate--alanine ligase
MRPLPLDLGMIHFVGIGGIGMSGLAEILNNLGYQVQGSDVAANANVQRLRGLGIEITVGHAAENVEAAQVVVVSSAIKDDNPEVAAARQRLIPVVRRAEMLMRIKWSVAVGGTHGKTTTTSMIAALLDAAHMDPTVINGGIINAYGTNARLGAGDWMVVEADESDGSFVKLPATIAVVTNIDPEHMEFYGSLEALHDAFEAFVENIPFYGVAILCIDHPVVQTLMGRIADRRIVTYGLSSQADVRALNLAATGGVTRFDVALANRVDDKVRTLEGLSLPSGLAEFGGVKRRFTKTGEAGGITVIDDYGHHPVEITAVLAAARHGTKGRVIAVVQPHRYTRLADLFDEFCTCFNDADHVIVAEVYPAGEAPIEGVDRDALVEGLRARGHRNVVSLEDPDDLPRMVRDIAEPGDLVVCLGAGNITAWANDLPSHLERLDAAGGARAAGAGT